MRWFVTTKDFQNLNVGVALDEGMASPDREYVLFNGERCIWRKYRVFFTRFRVPICLFVIDLRITCPGQPGHGSLLLDDTAGEKLRRLLDRFFAFREQEKRRLEDDPLLTIGDVTTLNLTQIEVRRAIPVVANSTFALCLISRFFCSLPHRRTVLTSRGRGKHVIINCCCGSVR